MDLTDSVALVTGGASGLGAATASRLAAAGMRVFALDRSIEGFEPLERISYLEADVTDGHQVEEAVAVAAATGPLRAVVNCAGIAPSARIVGRNGTHDLGLYAEVIRVNLIGTFTVLAVAARAIAQNPVLDEDGQRGTIVNTASIAAFEGQVGQAAYASSKGGVVGLTLAAARDLASFGIRVNAIAPGIVDTPMLATVSEGYRASISAGVPFPQRLAQPGEYAQLVQLILEHDYINGETIRMDGALRMSPR